MSKRQFTLRGLFVIVTASAVVAALLRYGVLQDWWIFFVVLAIGYVLSRLSVNS